MKEIKRDLYLNRLIERRENGLIKVVTGIRRSGKSYLLFNLFYKYLVHSGVSPKRIITIALDDEDYEELHKSKKLSAYIKGRLTDKEQWYVFLDEVQLCENFTDIGLRNAQLNFRQQEENHIMENIIYNELRVRGFNVDVGVVVHSEKNKEGKVLRNRLEIDFVCNLGSRRYYIQSAFSIPDKDKMEQEQKSLIRIDDSFKKIIVVKDRIKLWRTEKGIVVMGIMDFLLNQNSLDL